MGADQVLVNFAAYNTTAAHNAVIVRILIQGHFSTKPT